MTVLDLDKISSAPVESDPYRHFSVSDAIVEKSRESVVEDFPKIPHGGSYPANWPGAGPAMKDLLRELSGPAIDRIFEEKLQVPLVGKPKVITLRGVSRPKDGSIHPDSVHRLATVLFYCNRSWEAEGGKLRILRSATDMNASTNEVEPVIGNMLAFRRANHSYHGHPKFIGIRKALQVNWMIDKKYAAYLKGHIWISALSKLFTFK